MMWSIDLTQLSIWIYSSIINIIIIIIIINVITIIIIIMIIIILGCINMIKQYSLQLNKLTIIHMQCTYLPH